MTLIKKYILTISWLALMLFLTLSPGSSIPSVSIVGIDKLVHLFLFFILFIVLTIELKRENTTNLIVFISTSICLFIGVMIECIQIYIPQRTFSMLDILANTSGIILGAAALILIKKKF